MNELNKVDIENREQNYKYMVYAIKDQFENEKDLIANLSNASAIIKFYIDDCNWAGFYLNKEDTLVLGPFQGLPACIRIPSGRGVCGTAFKEKKVHRVFNVHEFEGHIACDGASNSEIVLPIIDKNSNVFGVLDIDSPSIGRFTELEEKYLIQVVKVIEENL
ncbi:GAF domain-containing protein [Clostridium cavendishii DSM 21758]|uniref:GAF domain-containing protein n=1 Tax=Clostridium cavendishii DSM 21758 TaxID=1121302 RepID=A0A1M6CXJ6_9CLOT|nr:GAF domain-containing protein [Clostridium cavendishii]SHI65752.1 GAF domain-containing protein [Clostridium cavendishii DSM 21758]